MIERERRGFYSAWKILERLIWRKDMRGLGEGKDWEEVRECRGSV